MPFQSFESGSSKRMFIVFSLLVLLFISLLSFTVVKAASVEGQANSFSTGGQDGYAHFEELGAQIKSIRFGKEAPRGLSFTSQEYITDDTNRIYYLFQVQFTKQVDQPRSFAVEAALYSPAGQLINRHLAHRFQIRPGSEELYAFHYLDWNQLGYAGQAKWPSGKYRLDLVVGGHTVASGYFHITETNNRIGNSSANLNNKGLVAQQGDWIYFVDERGILHRIRNNGQDLARLTKGTALYLNVQGPWIYYVSADKGDIISRTRIDGRGAEEVISHDQASFLMLYRDALYYINHSDQDRLYRVSLDGTRKKSITDTAVCQFTIFEDHIYYIAATKEKNKQECKTIYRLTLDGQGATQLSTAKAEGLVVTAGWLYFIDPADKRALYRLKLDDGQLEPIVTEGVHIFHVGEEWLYYQTELNRGRIIYKLHLSTGEVTKMETKVTRQPVRRDGREKWEFPYTYINIANDWLYYSTDNKLHTNQYRLQTKYSSGGEEIKGISDWDWRRW